MDKEKKIAYHGVNISVPLERFHGKCVEFEYEYNGLTSKVIYWGDMTEDALKEATKMYASNCRMYIGARNMIK